MDRTTEDKRLLDRTVTGDKEKFFVLRHAIYENFVAKNAPIKKENLSLSDLVALIEDVGQDYIEKNKGGLYIGSDLEEKEKPPRTQALNVIRRTARRRPDLF